MEKTKGVVPKDLLVEGQIERLLETKSSQAIVGEIIGKGRAKSYLPNPEENEWAPKKITSGGRTMVTFNEFGHITGPRLGLETLRPFLQAPMEVLGSKSQGSPDLVMLPYVRFQGENFAPEKSKVFILTRSQFTDIQKLDEKK
ncbi:hypothetical protein KKA02_02655 [Patescibacteria group bacterium]|nr:hypothetical protein [Patescibacteria group bacterium]